MEQTVVELKDVSYVYPDGIAALKGISLSVPEGVSLGVIGPNGAGKSTLLLALNGILSTEGEIRMLGFKLEKGNLLEIRRRVGLVFQDPDTQLFMPTVEEDVAFGPLNMGLSRDDVAKRVESALMMVDMPGSERRMPHHLSVGEKKRISIATVLSMDPEILLLGEPTTNLDPRSRRRLIDLLGGLKHTKIIASHDMGLIRSCCQKVAVINGGEMVGFGNADEILSDESILASNGLV